MIVLSVVLAVVFGCGCYDTVCVCVLFVGSYMSGLVLSCLSVVLLLFVLWAWTAVLG